MYNYKIWSMIYDTKIKIALCIILFVTLHIWKISRGKEKNSQNKFFCSVTEKVLILSEQNSPI